MKTGSFKGLLCREYYLIKVKIPSYIVMVVTFTLLPVLMVLSSKYGNIALVIKNSNIGDALLPMIEVTKFMPALCAVMFVSLALDMGIPDINPLWESFRLSSPVKGIKFAAARYTITAACTLISAVLGLASTFLMAAVDGKPVAKADIAVTFVILAFFLLFTIAGQISTLIFRSQDKGMLALLGVMMTIGIAISSLIINNDPLAERTPQEQFDFIIEMKNKCTELLPLSLVVIILALIAGFLATAALYKRRLK
ncbi:MAG: ABC-2 transporter permease [Oscillospiraceae bacterium]|nr:ABC-2 transporter permease [Oscillospiraceae bacterium]